MIKVVPKPKKEKIKKKVTIEMTDDTNTNKGASRDIVTGWEGLGDSPLSKVESPTSHQKEPSSPIMKISLLSPPSKKEFSALKKLSPPSSKEESTYN